MSDTKRGSTRKFSLSRRPLRSRSAPLPTVEFSPKLPPMHFGVGENRVVDFDAKAANARLLALRTRKRLRKPREAEAAMPQHLISLSVFSPIAIMRGDDWPPSPASPFTSLLLGQDRSDRETDGATDTKARLSGWSASARPKISPGTVSVGKAYTVYVPNNSLAGDKTSTKTSKKFFLAS